MLGKGNGEVSVCATNLVRTVRHTVPYERYKGIKIDVIDKPITDGYLLQVAVDEVLTAYEPRISARDVEIVANNPQAGGIELRINAS